MKKSVFAILSLTLATSAFAQQPPRQLSKPSRPAADYLCVSRANGMKYKVYYTQFTEIHEYAPNGKHLGYQDSISADVKWLESNPPQKLVTFIHEEGDVVAEVLEGLNGIRMRMDGDDSIICKSGRRR